MNEDAYRIEEDLCLFVVADGMGGHRGGQTASAMAVELLPKYYRQMLKAVEGSLTQDAIIEALGRSIAAVSREIFEAGKQKGRLHRMGTTLVTLLLARGHAFISHLGDSRAYILRDGDLHRLTEDHSFVNGLVQLGMLEPEESEQHPAKNLLTIYAGMKHDLQPDVAVLRLRLGDRFLLCSDGVWGMIPHERIQRALNENQTSIAACRRLITRANANGGEDNLTAMIIGYGDAPARTDRPPKTSVRLKIVTTNLDLPTPPVSAEDGDVAGD